MPPTVPHRRGYAPHSASSSMRLPLRCHPRATNGSEGSERVRKAPLDKVAPTTIRHPERGGECRTVELRSSAREGMHKIASLSAACLFVWNAQIPMRYKRMGRVSHPSSVVSNRCTNTVDGLGYSLSRGIVAVGDAPSNTRFEKQTEGGQSLRLLAHNENIRLTTQTTFAV